MNYLEFLARWYNLPFLLFIAAGVLTGILRRVTRRRGTAVSTGLVAAGVVGLTWNGALHDLGIGDYEDRFALVLAASAMIGTLFGWSVQRARSKLFPAVEGLAFTVAGLEGTEARMISREVDQEPGSGRAQWRDSDGVMHLVRVHTPDSGIRFGRSVRLVEYDAESRSYRVEGV
ncbi:MAG: hypothetical protein M8841_01425 [marine benthic group bacterium]|nr:hypothetical protein [Gemmatimonadota bacterium]